MPFLLYFAAIGLAFMLLEIALIQKFILFLGYPTRTLSVILFSLLLSSGIGSYVSGFISKEKPTRKIVMAGSFIILIALIYLAILTPLFAVLLSQPSIVRITMTFLMIMPLGFFMGIPFPTGIGFAALSQKTISVPWIWVTNGAFSVLGSILTTAIGITIGLNYAILFATMLYFVAVSSMLLFRASTK